MMLNEKTYTVVPGDTLSGIGTKLGVRWQTIWENNRETLIAVQRKKIGPRSPGQMQIGSPDWIWPGTVLTIASPH